MPYIAIKAYKKDEETKKKVVEQINEIFLREWGCPQSAISVSIEEFTPEEFAQNIENKELVEKNDVLMIKSGEKRF